MQIEECKLQIAPPRPNRRWFRRMVGCEPSVTYETRDAEASAQMMSLVERGEQIQAFTQGLQDTDGWFSANDS